LRELFISEDKRRGRARLTLLSWIVAVVMVALSIGAIAAGIKSIQASASVETLDPVATTPGEPGVSRIKPPAAAAPQDGGCPTDPAQWSKIPYEMPASDKPVYKIDPPCVMEQVEQQVKECLNASAEAGRNWSLEDDEGCYSLSGFTKPLTGETLDDGPERSLICSEVVGGELTTEVVFYTAGEEGLVVDVLIVTRPEQPSIYRRYDCETGELVEETEDDGTKGFVVYWPVLYEDGRWRMGYQPDIYHEVDADTLDPHTMVETVLLAQGREASVRNAEPAGQ
jgi:hypothetical protein